MQQSDHSDVLVAVRVPKHNLFSVSHDLEQFCRARNSNIDGDGNCHWIFYRALLLSHDLTIRES